MLQFRSMMKAPLLLAYVLRNLLLSVPVMEHIPIERQYFDGGNGELTVMFENQMRIGSIPRGSTRIRFLTLNLSASCDADIKIHSIDIKHVGLGGSDDVSGIYLMKDYRRLTRSISFNGNDVTAHLRLRDFVIPKCEAVKVDVLGDMDSDAAIAGEHGVSVEDPRSIGASAHSIVFDHAPDSVRVTTAPVSAGSIAVNFLPLTNSRLRYGRLMTAARMQFSADNESDHLLRSMTLTNNGSARNYDLIRLFMETGAREQVTRVAPHMDRNKVTLHFDPPFILAKGTTRLLLLQAEVRGSSMRTVSFTLEEDGDLDAVEQRRR